MTLLAYLALAFALLAALARVILTLGRTLARCPEDQGRAQAAAMTIATGYLAIGGGAVTLIAAILSSLQDETPPLLAALGFAALILGLGFTQAAATLRAALHPVTSATTKEGSPVVA